jgi:hypothetical protein
MSIQNTKIKQAREVGEERRGCNRRGEERRECVLVGNKKVLVFGFAWQKALRRAKPPE